MCHGTNLSFLSPGWCCYVYVNVCVDMNGILKTSSLTAAACCQANRWPCRVEELVFRALHLAYKVPWVSHGNSLFFQVFHWKCTELLGEENQATMTTVEQIKSFVQQEWIWMDSFAKLQQLVSSVPKLWKKGSECDTKHAFITTFFLLSALQISNRIFLDSKDTETIFSEPLEQVFDRFCEKKNPNFSGKWGLYFYIHISIYINIWNEGYGKWYVQCEDLLLS